MLFELLIASVLGGLLLACFFRYRKVRILERIPGPPALPLFGNSLQMIGSHTDTFQAIIGFCKYGRGVCRVYMGLQPYCILYRAPAVEALLSSNTILDKSKDYEFVEPWLGKGLLTSTGTKWRSRRKLLTPAFHFKILDDFIDVFNRQSLRLVQKLETLADGKEFDVFPIITLCTLDIIMESAMGTDADVQSGSESDYVKALYGISALVHHREFSPWLHRDFVFNLLGYGRQQQRYLDVLHGWSLSTIKNRREEYSQAKVKAATEKVEEKVLGKKKRLAFLDLLLEELESSKDQLTDEELREEVDTFMFEGHDTTASGISFTLYILGRHPEIQERVYEEIKDVLGDHDGDIAMDHVRNLRLLESCIKEALRIFPPVPFFLRRLRKPTVIDGYDVPEGTTMMVLTYTLHRDPHYFPDPEKFDPDRFLVDTDTDRHPFAYVPFSAGPRNCIGQKFAMLEEKVVLASVLRRFRVTATQDRSDLNLMAELIMRPEGELKLQLTKRERF